MAILLLQAKPKVADLKPIMCQRGELLYEESFTPESFKKNWVQYKGKWEIEKEQLKMAEVASDGHHPEGWRNFEYEDAIVQFSFRVQGAKWMGIGLDNKEHVARVLFSPENYRLMKMSGIGATTKSEKIDERKFKFDPAKWYRALAEFQGNEILVQIDGVGVAFGESTGMNVKKTKLHLLCGGETAWFDEIKVWKALPDKNWASRKQQLPKSK